METLMFVLAFDLEPLVNIFTVALGLGLVIFVHELGHFAVAKWCDVHVERFSIGFGPILLSRKWGQTEYALSAIPFGGYVKMLGQDDVDPGQLTNDELAQDPRSYTSKSIPQRMAIISAGVTMNIVTGLMFFVIAFLSGVEQPDRQVGAVEVGSPAWLHGIRPGDVITEVNGNPIDGFTDVMRNVALSDGPVAVRGQHADGTKFSVTLNPGKPKGDRTRRQIGVAFARSLEIPAFPKRKNEPAVTPGSPAARAQPPFLPGDRIRRVGDVSVESFPELQSQLSDHRGEPVDLFVQRAGKGSELVKIRVPPQPYRTLGLQMDIGKLVAVRPGSPAEQAGFKVGDKITIVDGRNVGSEINPMRLPETFSDRIGQPVAVRISRESPGSEPESKQLTVTPEATPGWVEHPEFPHHPLSITSIGAAYHLIPTVYTVDPNGPAAKAGIKELQTVTAIEFVLPQDLPEDLRPEKPITIAIGDDNWAYAFWQLQQQPVSSVKLSLKAPDGGKAPVVTLTPAEASDWFVPDDRGLPVYPKFFILKADSIGEALAFGWRHTANSTKDIYLTLRGLVTGNVSIKELNGPIRIAKFAYAQAGTGLAHFVLFLGIISVNLAVINFLPIPVLDGGHMMFLTWEAIIRRRPNERIVAAATYCGLFFVLSLMVFVMYLDLFGH